MDYLQEDILQRQHKYRDLAKAHNLSLPSDYKAVKVRIVTRLYFKELMDLQNLDRKKIGKLAAADVMLNFSWKLQQSQKVGIKGAKTTPLRLSATVRLIEVSTARVLSTKRIASRPFEVVQGKIMADKLSALNLSGDAEGVLKELAHKIARTFYPIIARGKGDPRLKQNDPLKGDLTWEE